MKFSIIFAIATGLMFGLLGCKPKETTLSGQVFIVTQGAENIKLGDVEILLIEKPQVTDFLQKKQPASELEMASRQHEFTVAKDEAEKALAHLNATRELTKAATRELTAVTSQDAANAQADYDYSFIANNPLLTNADYAKIKAEGDILLKGIAALKQQADSLLTQGENFRKNNPYLANYPLATQLEDVSAKMNGKERELKEVERLAKEKLEAAGSGLATAKANLEDFSIAKGCLENFSPDAIKKVRTDADGRFSITYPRNKAFTIFAKAKRAVIADTGVENYYWLLDAPNSVENAQFFLSNNNLIFTDPDGYFKLKPKP